MDSNSSVFDRRAMLIRSSTLVASLAAIPLIVLSGTARAAKADRELLRYQDGPKNGKTCADCWAYVPGRSASQGTCKAVEGPVAAKGWCMAYSPKRKSKKS